MVRRMGSARQWIGKRMSPLLFIVPALNSPGRIRAQLSMSTFSQNAYLVIHFPFLSLRYVSGHSNPILLPKSSRIIAQLALCSMPSLLISTLVSTCQQFPCVSSSTPNSDDTQDLLCVMYRLV